VPIESRAVAECEATEESRGGTGRSSGRRPARCMSACRRQVASHPWSRGCAWHCAAWRGRRRKRRTGGHGQGEARSCDTASRGRQSSDPGRPPGCPSQRGGAKRTGADAHVMDRSSAIGARRRSDRRLEVQASRSNDKPSLPAAPTRQARRRAGAPCAVAQRPRDRTSVDVPHLETLLAALATLLVAPCDARRDG